VRLIQEAADQALVWQQPSALKNEFALRAGDEIVATLRWQKALGSLALAETAAGSWTFKRAGFWQPRVTARPADAERDIATFKPDSWSGGGALTVEAGRVFRLVSTSFWRGEWAWQDADGAPLVRFASRGSLKTEALVTLTPAAAALPETAQLDDLYRPLPPEAQAPPSVALPELPLLVTLGWYLLVLAAQDAAAAAAAAT
jgi:hypothetical protein